MSSPTANGSPSRQTGPAGYQQAYQLIMQAPVPISIYKGPDLVVEFANDAALRFSGKTAEVLGRKLEDVLPEAAEQGFVEILHEVMRTGIARQLSEVPVMLRIAGKEEHFYMNITYQPFYEEDGSVSGVLASSTDVTEQVMTRKKVEESQQYFENIIQQAPDPIIILKGEDLVVSVCNDAILRLWKTDRSVIGKKFTDVLPEMREQDFPAMMRDVYRTGNTFYGYEMPAYFDRGNGEMETVYFNFVYQPYREKDGTITGILCLATAVNEQVAVKKRLKESEERLSIALESAGLGTWDYAPATGLLYWSERTRNIFGIDQDKDISLQTAIAVIAPEDRERVQAAIQTALQESSGGRYEIEYAVINAKDGQRRTVKAQGRAFFEKGEAVRFTGTLMDISAEMKSREDQKKLKTLVDSSAHLMSILELDGRNSYINKAGMEMLGLENEEEVRNTHISQLHTPEDVAFVQANVVPAIMETGSWAGQMNVRHVKTGEVFPIYNNAIRIDDPHTGKPMAIGALMRDLRPEIAARQALVDSEQKFRRLMMQAPVPMALFRGPEMTTEIVNDAYLPLLGRAREELVGQPLFRVVPEMRERLEPIALRLLETGEPFQATELETVLQRHGQPETCYFNTSWEPIREANGSISGMIVVAHEVTPQVLARRRIEENEKELQRRVQERTAELERKNAELEQFAHVSSHDLQEPLRKIRMFAEMIRQRELEHLSGTSQAQFEKIMDAATRMSDSLRELLNYTSLSREEQFSQVDLNDVLRDVCSDLELVIAQTDAQIQKDDLPVVHAIPLQMHQLFYNLINNALKFSRPGEKPGVSIGYHFREKGAETGGEGLEPGKPFHELVVKDNGIGFAQEHAEKIFTIFQRLHDRRSYSGTGIGLALCRKVVTNHGGRIFARSRPGEGAAFHILLPAS